MKPLISICLALSTFIGLPSLASADPDAGAWDPRVDVEPSATRIRGEERAFKWDDASYSERMSYLVELGTPRKFASRAAMGGFPIAGHPLEGDGRLLVIRPQRGGAAFIATF